MMMNKVIGSVTRNKNEQGSVVRAGACEACYTKKVKCDLTGNQEKDGKACSRCKKRGVQCVPRYKRRGRPVTASRSSTKAPSTPVKFPPVRKIEGWRSCEAFLAQPNAEAQYRAASNLVGIFKSMGTETNPEWLVWACRMMMLMAVHDKCMGLLHAATTLAVSAKIEVDHTFMQVPAHANISTAPLMTDSMAKIMQLCTPSIEKPIQEQIPTCAGYLLRVEYGERIVEPDPFYQELFLNGQEVEYALKSNPGLTKFWHHPVNSEEDVKKFVNGWMRNIISKSIKAVDGVMSFEHSLKDVKIHDRHNNVWMANLVESTKFAEKGRRLWQVFAFVDLRRITNEKYIPPPPHRSSIVMQKRKRTREASGINVVEERNSKAHQPDTRTAELKHSFDDLPLQDIMLEDPGDFSDELSDDFFLAEFENWPDNLASPDSTLVMDTFQTLQEEIQ